MTSPNK